ncbi:hypothetical protein K3217_22260, partial [bacterium BD-1]|nr:hypothetical protein [Ottowia caeni]
PGKIPNLLKTAAISEALDHNTSFKDLANFFKGFYQKHLAAPQLDRLQQKAFRLLLLRRVA